MFAHTKRTLTAASIVGAGALLAGAPAAGVGKSAGGTIHVYEVDPSLASNLGNIVITGAIADRGKDQEGVGKHHRFNKLILANGSFEVDPSKLNPPTRLDAKSCSFSGSGSAAVPIVAGTGTGAYRGITGTTKANLTIVGVLRKGKDGKCNANAAPLAGFAWVKASGKVSFK